jgi:hypothetical protein
MAEYNDVPFTLEGGKYFLAEALFREYRFTIRCPYCQGSPGKAGFIHDQAGKSTHDGRPRRQFACQRTASRKCVEAPSLLE